MREMSFWLCKLANCARSTHLYPNWHRFLRTCSILWRCFAEAPQKQETEAKEESKSVRQQATGAAVTGIYAGLKLTGLALRVATDMATSLSKEAERAIAASEAQRAEQVGNGYCIFHVHVDLFWAMSLIETKERLVFPLFGVMHCAQRINFSFRRPL